MLHKWMQALLVVFGLTTAYSSSATIITGADGLLAPTTDYTLPYRADGVFDFSSIYIGSNITLRFDAGMPNITLLSLGDILITGVIDGTGINNLALESLGQINFTGTFIANGLSSIAGKEIGIGACLSISPYNCGSLNLIVPSTPSLSFNQGELPLGQGIVLLSVPEPGTLWLMTLLLPMLVTLRWQRK